jgi:Trypsin-co-occurring domain 2
MSESMGLAEFIDQVKNELLQEPRDGSTKLLVIEEVNLEIQCVVSRGVSGGINVVQVVQLGGNAKRDDTHTVRVKLQPLLSHDERVRILRDDPRWADIQIASAESTVKGLVNGVDSQLDD